MDVSRRALLGGGAWLAGQAAAAPGPESRLKVSIFSKHLGFLHGAMLADAAAKLGFDGVDLTVRAKGHVEPARVRQDLPGLVAAIRSRGLEVPMVTTDIVDADTPYAGDILATIADLGIHHYRWLGFKYDHDQPFAAQLERLKPRVARLAELNSRYKVRALYHTHSGKGLVGASIWDLYVLLRSFDPQSVAVNYDVAHATIEGGLGGWIHSFRILGPYLGGIAVKDFVWARNSRGEWDVEWRPLGQGMVRFSEFFAMVKESGFHGPLQVHLEYPLPESPYRAIQQDLDVLRRYIREAGL